MPAKRKSEVTKSYGFDIYPSVRKKQVELARHYNLSAARLVVELIKEDHEKVFGKDDEE